MDRAPAVVALAHRKSVRLEEKRASEFAIRASGGLYLHNHGLQLLAERDKINPNATSEVVKRKESIGLCSVDFSITNIGQANLTEISG